MDVGTKRKKTKLDIHLHTPTSDGRGTPHEYVKAIQKAGLDGVCITDHHVSGGESSRMIAKAIRAAGFLCFMGCEYSTANGHLLIYGVDVAELDLPRYPAMQDVIWKVRERGGVAIPSHPFYGWKKKLGKDVFKMKDLIALESANAKLKVQIGQYYDTAAENAVEQLKLAAIGTSDAHHASAIGTCYTEFDGAIRRPADFIKALLSGEYRPVTNKRRVTKQRTTRTNWSSWSDSSRSGQFGDRQLPLYATGRGAGEDTLEEGLWEDLQDEDWEAYDRRQDEANEVINLEDSGFLPSSLQEEAFTDPFFVAKESDANRILEEWAERSKRRTLRKSRIRGFFG